MENIWRFYDGWVSGIVVAENEEQALSRAQAYLSGLGMHEQITPRLRVWPCIQDDDYDSRFPWAVAVAY